MALRNAPADSPLTPARKSELLRALDNFFLQRIKDLFDLFFDEAEFQLFGAAQNAQSNQQQTQLLETLAQLKRNRKHLETETLEELQSGAKRAITPPASISPDQLALIAHDVFEAQLILDTILRKANQRWFEPLYCLAKRYSQLRAGEIDAHDLPMGVMAIGHTIHAILQPQIPLPLLPIVLRAFDSTVLQHLGEVYDSLNECFKQWGILPNLEIDFWRELHQAKIGARIRQEKLPTRSGGKKEQAIFATPNAEIASAELLSTAQQILELIRNPNGANQTTQNDDREAVLSILATLQQHAGEGSTSLLQRLRDHAENQHIPAPSGPSADSLSIIDTLFADIEAALRNSPALIDTLRQLQIPLARAAVQQPELLGNKDHPAHRFVNLLNSLTSHSDLPNPPLEHKLSDVIEPITHGTADPEQFFLKAAADLAPLLTQQQKARERNIRRIIDTYEGQQQLARAHSAVDRELQRRNTSAQIPALALKLLDRGWRHILTLTYMRQGESSDAWSEYFALFDELLWQFQSAQAQQLSKTPEITQHREEADHLLDRIGRHLDNFFPGDYRNTALVDELRAALFGNAPIETVPAPQLQTQATHNPRELQLELDQAYPHLVRWFRRAREFKAGDEFVHFRDPTLRERYSLAWVSENQQNFVFVNVRGHKVFDFDLVDLANEMAKGLHPVGNQAQWPAIEQAMLGTANSAYQQLAFNSTHDTLTGLLNRKEFEHRLGNALLEAKNQQLQHALLYIDVDQFSLINNLLGHVAGDAVLMHVSRIIAEISPSLAVLARTGGNEFAVLIEDCDLMRAHACAEQICRTINNQPYVAEEHRLTITVSIGVIAITKYADGTVTLLRDALAATHTAKELGRNRVYVLQSDTELHSRREKLLKWIDKMTDLLDNDYLVLRAQPIQKINNTAAVQHYEILLGLRDKDGVVSAPGEFIEAAECYNRMQRVDRWVIERAFAWLAGLAEENQPIPQLSINLSGNSLNDPTFLDFLVDCFGNFRVTPSAICFEITETATIKNLANAADFIQQVKKIGCTFALDDFGTGLSSYEYLKHLPVDFLKIDGMFIVDIDKNPSDYAMVKSINEIAHFMGKKTVAEFVESDATFKALREIGIDFVQGYHIGQPRLLDEL